MAEEIDFENGRNSNIEGLVTLTFDPAIRHTVVHHSSTSTYIPNFIQIEETFCGRTDVRTGGRTFFPSILLGRLSEVDLIIIIITGVSHSSCVWLRVVSQQRLRRPGVRTKNGWGAQERIHGGAAASRRGTHWTTGRLQQGRYTVGHQHRQTAISTRLMSSPLFVHWPALNTAAACHCLDQQHSSSSSSSIYLPQINKNQR